ncbi:flagellar biosynthesis/type III secretory pathway M-ring protein FliF/YscJ [Psychrobacter luti]|uniref:Flagellar biosynthesis/type III secretory pathway M-ring protein FliF/YscJ n=1 Tax=Psychrobacter luti TaxID=198481 RepID=A0A839TBX6_9GAMM|nr:flagellar biosynthesis/type III secretory pathway M-ring protein FliF/YscJ [Psychrobacter luti]
MNHLYLNMNVITGTVFIFLLSSLTGCALLSKSHDESNANRISDKITLPQQLDIKVKDNSQNIEVPQQDSKGSSPTELFTYAATLNARDKFCF